MRARQFYQFYVSEGNHGWRYIAAFGSGNLNKHNNILAYYGQYQKGRV